VNIPIKMHAATESKDFHFNYLHKKCHNRIRYIKKCPHCDEEVAPEEIVKGYEYEKDRYVILEDKDLESIEAPLSRSIDILDFIDLKDIDPIYYQKSYYLSPEETAQKAYKLLCQAMADTGKVAIARMTMRSKQYLACLRVIEQNILVLETMYYPAEIRQLEADWAKVQPTETEVAMACQLIENLASPFQPEKYRDELREQIKELIEKKIAGESFSVTAAPEPGKVIDLMEALRASIALTETSAPKEESGAKVSKKATKKKDKPLKEESKRESGAESLDMDQEKQTESIDAGTSSKTTLTPRGRRKAKGA